MQLVQQRPPAAGYRACMDNVMVHGAVDLLGQFNTSLQVDRLNKAAPIAAALVAMLLCLRKLMELSKPRLQFIQFIVFDISHHSNYPVPSKLGRRVNLKEDTSIPNICPEMLPT